MVDYARDPTPYDNFGGGSATWVVWAYTRFVTYLSFLFFLFLLFLLYLNAPRSHFLTDRNDLYAKTLASGQGCAFWSLHNIPLHLGVKLPKFSPKWA